MDVRSTWDGAQQTALEGPARLATAANAPRWVGLLLSFALGMILIVISLIINSVLYTYKEKRADV